MVYGLVWFIDHLSVSGLLIGKVFFFSVIHCYGILDFDWSVAVCGIFYCCTFIN